MATLFVDNTPFSSAAQLVAKYAGKNLKVVHVDDSVKSSEEFKSASANGEIPAFTEGNTKSAGYTAVAASILGNQSDLLGTSSETKEVEKWVQFLSKDLLPSLATKDNKLVGKFHKINKDLSTVVFFIGNHLTIVDLAFYAALHPVVKEWKYEDRITFNHLTRWFDFVQHQEQVTNDIFAVIPIDKEYNASKANAASTPAEKSAATPVKEGKTEQPVANEKKAAAQQQPRKEPTKEEKEAAKKSKEDRKAQNKQARGAAAPAEAKKELPIDISRLDIRVGKIVDVKKHEQAESLYVEKIDLGEGTPRQVVSGLVKFVPIEEMQNRMVVVLCNLKPSKLRGVDSQAMVLAASNDDHTQVELVTPPNGATPGTRVSVAGFPGTPDEQLNPKHKVFEQVSPDMKTNDECVACYKGVPLSTEQGICTVKSIKNGGIK